MMATLQWFVLAVCALCTLWRLPAALRGRNTSLFWVFFLCTFAIALSLPTIYLPVDAVLGGHNIANLLLRLAFYPVFFLLALRLAAAYRSSRARWWIRGPVGLVVLIVLMAGTLGFFLASDLPVSRTNVTGYADAQATVKYYAWLGHLYPAYAAACLIGPTAAALRSRQTLYWMASACITLGLGLVITSTVLVFTGGERPIESATAYAAVLPLAIGLTLVWLYARRQSKLPALRPLMGQ